jgi:UDP-N-acetylmuramoyl-L-alanyl-D-glutamate--2,6-diaminopimelate ligase
MQKIKNTYHYILAILSVIIYRFPSKKIKVIAVTGTKGKSSTVELIGAILEEAGHKVALSSTIHFKIGENTQDNMYKMSMPGRFFMQQFLRKAVQAKCTYAIVEMTSQGYLQHRQKFIHIDTFVFTNLSPEHIESHGSYENYVSAKVTLAKGLEWSKKNTKILIVNGDDKESEKFLVIKAGVKKKFGIADASPYEIKKEGISFTFRGQTIASPLSGLFNLYNILAAITTAEAEGVSIEIIKKAIEKFNGIKGRLEKIVAGTPGSDLARKQDFTVIIDYAHTADSLEKVYQVFQGARKIAVLGGTGGGRDRWKRKEMGKLAARYCDHIVLTNEDPYDENPMQIIEDVKEGVVALDKTPTIIMDRREAIRDALAHANTGDVVLITGKGTDPYIMGPQGHNMPWSDATVAREELEKILKTR